MKNITLKILKVFVKVFQKPPGLCSWILLESVWTIALLNENMLLKKEIRTIRIVNEKNIQEIYNIDLQYMGLPLMTLLMKTMDTPIEPLEREIKNLSSVF